MGEVERRKFDVFQFDVLPYIHFCPVGDRKNPEVFADMLFTVKKVPKLWTLIFGIPLAELVTMGKETLFGPGFFLIPPSASHGSINLVFFQGVQQGHGLQGISARIYTCFLPNPTRINAFLNRSYIELHPQLFYQLVPESNGFWKVVACVYMDQRKRNLGRVESLFG